MAHNSDCKDDHETHSVEEHFSKIGARIDELIRKANQMKGLLTDTVSDLREKKASTVKRTEGALDELKTGLNSAWADINHAWEDIREGTERATEKLVKPEKEANAGADVQREPEQVACKPGSVNIDKPITEPDDFQALV